MRLAIPVSNGCLCAHFGHCDRFALIDVDPAQQRIICVAEATPPPHAPGVLPRWLREQGVDVVIAGGMGRRALSLFSEVGVEVLTGAPVETPEALARAYISGSLEKGENVCDH